MAGNKVDICGVDTSTLPTLSHERMRELLKRSHAGDDEVSMNFIVISCCCQVSFVHVQIALMSRL